ncbi:trypsin-like peptidase domain-containing protein [Nocardioides sp. YIM 152315]|uniref:S1C family serine protease n=1 Tax=Nocardioides sp. YIM 152315 TaxID=3031760 RepID=UPI0023DA36CF|nr:trypsin-like peptidase domain-containing protein [Nocardioides sp. YIM 152315]MDF1605336.1 trypsin-like peptidase domain-containing protein [Nocardioides sp. YIM 152315]
MTSSDHGSTPPPPHNPYFTTPTTPPPSGPPTQPMAAAPPEPAARAGWSWRATVAGAVAGGVIAASVAVPVTWALDRSEPVPAADAPAATVPQQPDTGTVPQQPGTDGGLPDDSFGGGNDGLPFGGSTSDRTGDWSDATAEQSQGVVLIDTRTTSGEAAGTGLILDSSGLVLTNYHVVEGSNEVQVTVAATGDTYEATVLGHDQEADIALLQLDGASDLATVSLDDDGDPAVADVVTAVGNAQGQGFLSASTGSVVALDQSIDTQDQGTVQGEHLSDLIQTDAYVVGGYSGGALLDDEGEVVGVTTAASSGGAAESYAVPIDDALDVAEQIEDGQETDGVQVGPSAYLGIAITDTAQGVQVGQVESGGPAAAAGIEAGAVITGIDDTAITSYDVLRSALASYEPGDEVTLRWSDGTGAEQSATVALGESPVN